MVEVEALLLASSWHLLTLQSSLLALLLLHPLLACSSSLYVHRPAAGFAASTVQLKNVSVSRLRLKTLPCRQ